MERMPLVDKIPDAALQAEFQTNLGRALYNNPGICLPFKKLAGSVHFESHLGPRIRELVVLRLSAQLRSDVEWGQHFRLATTDVVYEKAWISVPEARDVRDGDLGGFSALERTAMEYAQAVERNDVTDEDWSRALEHFTHEELLDLTVLATVYGMACRLTNALGVPMDEGIEPISALDRPDLPAAG